MRWIKGAEPQRNRVTCGQQVASLKEQITNRKRCCNFQDQFRPVQASAGHWLCRIAAVSGSAAQSHSSTPLQVADRRNFGAIGAKTMKDLAGRRGTRKILPAQIISRGCVNRVRTGLRGSAILICPILCLPTSSDGECICSAISFSGVELPFVEMVPSLCNMEILKEYERKVGCEPHFALFFFFFFFFFFLADFYSIKA
ncbi:hypothetical protein K432DRAFT_121614 [Lepidopterella palustris CBS 459.81]|uniref:Uncharacterized protein n=1 Tax=Lepidopterella palustris CBS 459.81 TaxID=1314670 RepID=A0A8E2JCI0_9PEZI|nr:hypothetical protein K432DRAFT_121614 [Lepidopterella palustris CBS 459.81]